MFLLKDEDGNDAGRTYDCSLMEATQRVFHEVGKPYVQFMLPVATRQFGVWALMAFMGDGYWADTGLRLVGGE